MINNLTAMSQTRRVYDHRMREQVVRTGIRCLPRHLAIPRSTVGTWRRRGVRPVVSIEPSTRTGSSWPALGRQSRSQLLAH
jgi:hypothetical protein